MDPSSYSYLYLYTADNYEGAEVSRKRLGVMLEGVLQLRPWTHADTPPAVPGSRAFLGRMATHFDVVVFSPRDPSEVESWCRSHYGEIADEIRFGQQIEDCVIVSARCISFDGHFPEVSNIRSA